MKSLPLLKNITFSLIEIYQRFLSSILHIFLSVLTGSDQACRFHPTCSEYAKQALKTYGIIYGSFLSLYRILRCNPLSKGGYDPVINKK